MYTNPITGKVTTLNLGVKSLINDEEYLEVLAERLFLDESLRGECNVIEYLKTSLEESYRELIEKQRWKVISRLREVEKELKGGWL